MVVSKTIFMGLMTSDLKDIPLLEGPSPFQVQFKDKKGKLEKP